MSSADRKLTAIAPADLARVWPTIRAEVASVEAPEGLIPEDVYAMCRAGEATLFMLHVAGLRIGWTVLRLIGRDLHIWLLYAEPGFDPMSIFRDDLMAVARGATPYPALKLTFGSTRRGWSRVAPRHGFKVRHTTYECDVDSL
ncbi:hypothetical protein FHX57_001984 [Paraburkholderia tropica]|uniref:hypothetical protein n=1 Tax=Paraburkholderia tropica TaxID=92647 RepID=UPI0016087A27|nr:hypothetical protein [Paraburkholderia tropica]MBB2999653.1 hypothetical protein [Paraburkholderia tropica]